jgi:hypothetical protein
MSEKSHRISEPATVERRPCASNSRGNVHVFPQQKKTQRSFQRVSPEALYDVADNLSNCCPRGSMHGCIKETFTEFRDEGLYFNMDAAFDLVSECHEEYHLTRHDPDLETSFIDNLFQKSVQKVTRLGEGEGAVRFVMEWKIQGMHAVCKKAFAAAYGISVHMLEQASKRCKGTYSAKKVGHVKLRDENIPSFTYSEVENVFMDNLQEYPGKKLLFPHVYVFHLVFA